MYNAAFNEFKATNAPYCDDFDIWREWNLIDLETFRVFLHRRFIANVAKPEAESGIRSMYAFWIQSFQAALGFDDLIGCCRSFNLLQASFKNTMITALIFYWSFKPSISRWCFDTTVLIVKWERWPVDMRNLPSPNEHLSKKHHWNIRWTEIWKWSTGCSTLHWFQLQLWFSWCLQDQCT